MHGNQVFRWFMAYTWGVVFLQLLYQIPGITPSSTCSSVEPSDVAAGSCFSWETVIGLHKFCIDMDDKQCIDSWEFYNGLTPSIVIFALSILKETCKSRIPMHVHINCFNKILQKLFSK